MKLDQAIFDRSARIDALAQKYFEWDYRDMAFEAVVAGDDRSDDEIALELSMRAAYP